MPLHIFIFNLNKSYSADLMAEFQELVISLWASVGWNLNGWNVRVICNMFQLSAEHTWGNERGCGAIRRDSAAQ